MAETIAEDSPYIFMNQKDFETKRSKYELNLEMKQHFYTAYKYFL